MLSQAQLFVLHSISRRPIARLYQLPHDAPAGAYIVSLQRLRQRGLIEMQESEWHITNLGREAISTYTPPE